MLSHSSLGGTVRVNCKRIAGNVVTPRASEYFIFQQVKESKGTDLQVYVCVCVYTHKHTYMYIYTHIYNSVEHCEHTVYNMIKYGPIIEENIL